MRALRKSICASVVRRPSRPAFTGLIRPPARSSSPRRTAWRKSGSTLRRIHWDICRSKVCARPFRTTKAAIAWPAILPAIQPPFRNRLSLFAIALESYGTVWDPWSGTESSARTHSCRPDRTLQEEWRGILGNGSFPAHHFDRGFLHSHLYWRSHGNSHRLHGKYDSDWRSCFSQQIALRPRPALHVLASAAPPKDSPRRYHRLPLSS